MSTSVSAVTDGKTGGNKGRGRGHTPEPQPIALDRHDSSVPTARTPTKWPNGEYEASISLHSMVDAEKWCSALRRQQEPLAVLAVSTGSDNWAHAAIQILVLKVPHGAKMPRTTFTEGVIYQFGETELGALDANATFMRITIHEADALLANPTVKNVFSSQFNGAAPIVSGGQRKDKLGTTANERWNQARRSDAKLSLDTGLFEVIAPTMNAICPEIEILDEPKADDKTKVHAVWFNKTISMQGAYSMAKSHGAAVGIAKGDRWQFGMRVLCDHPQANEAAAAVRGSDVALARRKWRIDDIPSGRAAKGQVTDAVQTVGCAADIVY
ncbi:unnamed protein product, partial [Prorocentrum cordatum]